MREGIRAASSGSAIDWVTYYLGDAELIDELIRARQRGAQVRVTLEAQPRSSEINRPAIERLAPASALGAGLRAPVHPQLPGLNWRPSIHEKLYCFSTPTPVAFIGSYNPAKPPPGAPPNPEGDMDSGYNALVEFREPELVKRLVRHARAMHGGRHGVFERLARDRFQTLRSGDHEVHFWPRRWGSDPLRDVPLGRGTRVRIAASHVSGVFAARSLARAVRRGAELHVRTDGSRRRTPDETLESLERIGVRAERVEVPGRLPMHHKFMLVEGNGASPVVIFGSFNWTDRSRWLSHEIAVRSRDPHLVAGFDAIWEQLAIHVGGRRETAPMAPGR